MDHLGRETGTCLRDGAIRCVRGLLMGWWIETTFQFDGLSSLAWRVNVWDAIRYKDLKIEIIDGF